MQIYHQTLGQGKNLVFIHGFGFNSDVWLPLVQSLIQNHRVTLLDLPGFGRSKSSEMGYDLSSLVEVVESILPKEPVTLIGWSLGGMVASLFAYQYPSRIKKLITIGSNPCFIALPDWSGMKIDSFEQFAYEIEVDPTKALQKFLWLQLTASRDKKIYRQFYPTLHKIMFQYGIPTIATLQNYLAILRNYDLRNYLLDITCPQLHIFGELDSLAPISVAKKLQQLLPKAQIIAIPEATHLPFLTHAAIVLKILT